MAKIPLTIDKNYCASWTVWAGLRELIQNAKDAEDYEGKRMEITHYPKTRRLEIVTKNTYVQPANLLVLGRTSKGAGNQRGKFGEGFVLGVLALVRNHLDVKFRNGDSSWTVAFELPDVGHPLEGNELLTFKSRALQYPEADFVVEVDGVTAEAWGIVRNKFLFLTPPKAADKFEVGDSTLLLHPDKKGEVYVRGIFVRKFDDLSCGYDLNAIELDRDRQMIAEWDLHYTLARLWNEAVRTQPELMAPRVYEMAKQDAPDARHMRYHADERLIREMRERFEAENGAEAVPVTTNAEANDVGRLGGKPTMVSGVLKELLEKGGLSPETAKRRLEGVIQRRWTPDEVAADVAAHVRMRVLEGFLPNLVVVTFAGEMAGCRLIDENTVVAVDRRLLDQSMSDILRQTLPVEAQRLGVTPMDLMIALLAKEPLQSKRATPAPEF